MFKKYYTTQMSDSARELQTRFTKIRSGITARARVMSALTAAVIALASICASVVMAAVDGSTDHFFINGTGYNITPVLIENTMATHTDSYYVPLRATFEALGYEVYYDVDKSKYQDRIGKYSFPLYDNDPIYIGHDMDTGEEYMVDNSAYYELLKTSVTNQADMYIYGATGVRLNAEMPIIEMTKDGKTEYCQVGCEDYSYGHALPPVIIGSEVYVQLRAVANYVGGIDNIKWSDEAHDTYFDGALTFDEENLTVTISVEE